jgi:hypothetical protein
MSVAAAPACKILVAHPADEYEPPSSTIAQTEGPLRAPQAVIRAWLILLLLLALRRIRKNTAAYRLA